MGEDICYGSVYGRELLIRELMILETWQRLKVYETCKEMMEADENLGIRLDGICGYMHRSIEICNGLYFPNIYYDIFSSPNASLSPYYFKHLIAQWPELWEMRPEWQPAEREYWWGRPKETGLKERIEIMTTIIKKLKDEQDIT
jgi:hypothetical protein